MEFCCIFFFFSIRLPEEEDDDYDDPEEDEQKKDAAVDANAKDAAREGEWAGDPCIVARYCAVIDMTSPL